MAPTLYLACDLGAGNGKVFGNLSGDEAGEKYSIRSLVREGKESDFYSEHQKVSASAVHYVRGSNARLKGKFWIAGKDAASGVDDLTTAAQKPIVKIENMLQILLWSLVVRHSGNAKPVIQPGETNLVVIASHHDATKLGTRIEKELIGCHEVVADDKVYKIQVKMPSRSVVPEGGCVGDYPGEFSTLDIGELTARLINRNEAGEPKTGDDDQYSSPLGVGRLVQDLTESEIIANAIGIKGSRIEITRALIEASDAYEKSLKAWDADTSPSKPKKPKMADLHYRRGGYVKFTSDYIKCFKNWMPKSVGPALAKLVNMTGLEYRVVAFGGGVRLPGMIPFLRSKGIHIYDGDLLFANAESIYTKKLLPLLRSEDLLERENLDFEPFSKAIGDQTPVAAK